MRNKVVIVGAFNEIIELCENNYYEIVGIIDNEKIGYYRNYKILCNDSGVENLSTEIKKYPIIITPDKPSQRKKLKNHFSELGFKFGNLISNESSISRSAEIGKGSIIQRIVNVSSDCLIGEFVKLNTMCNIMHNSIIGDFTTVAPNAVVLGNVKIGENCYIGSNSTILPNISICDNVVIGAGSVVTKHISIPSILVGVPAKTIRKK